ncbi:SIR2 family protein [Vibrio parahaemolyticus]
MDIRGFIGQYQNHPVLFVGTGLSLRYLNNSYTWDGLLSKIAHELTGGDEFYFDIKAECNDRGKYNYTKVAMLLEAEFNKSLTQDRNGKFKEINDIFYTESKKGNSPSRFKIYITKLLLELDYKDEMAHELAEFKKIRKNIGSVITTNYDTLIEDVFDFEPLVGNDILLSNPYGSVYKIHGCVSNSDKVIITEEDYAVFNEKYELIRAQLLSIFIHNPIIFLGYNIGDENIKSLLKTIFTYVEPNSADAKRIRDNFLLVEYETGSNSHEICEHDIDLEGFATIRINKVKTDDFNEIYSSLSCLSLPVSAMDIRKVQNVVKSIYEGATKEGSIQVKITEDLDTLSNSDKILAIGSSKTITYVHQDTKGMMINYFDIVEEANHQLLSLIDNFKISVNQWFPIFAFSGVCSSISRADELKEQQIRVLNRYLEETMPDTAITQHTSIEDILSDQSVSDANKINAIIWAVHKNQIEEHDVRNYLLSMTDKVDTPYRRLLCTYDYVFYS